MIKIEIPKNSEVTVKAGVSAKNNKPYEIREQTGYAYLFDSRGNLNPHPTSIKVQLEPGDQPYAEGNYILAPQSLYSDRYGSLSIGRPKLIKTGVQTTVKTAA